MKRGLLSLICFLLTLPCFVTALLKGINVHYHPDRIDKLRDGHSATINISFSLQPGVLIERLIPESTTLIREITLVAFVENNEILDFNSQEFVIKDLSENVSILVTGKQMGRTIVNWTLEDPHFGDSVSASIPISVVRGRTRLHLIFTIVVGVLVIINNINLGCSIDLGAIKKIMKKPIAPLIGFACQFLFMPLASFTIGLLLFPDNILWRLGLFVLGCCPGGTGSNFWTLLFDGDVDLSITMTFVSTLAALGMMPLWIFTLGKQLLEDANVKNVKIPYSNLMGSLATLTFSLTIGVMIRRCAPRFAGFLEKLLKPFTAVLLTTAVIGGTFVSLYVFPLLTWKGVLAGLSVALGGYFVGAVVANACQLNRKQVIAVSIETALQNSGVAFVMLLVSLEQPESSLAAVPVIGQLFMTGVPLWITFLVYSIVKMIMTRIHGQEIVENMDFPDKTESFVIKEKNLHEFQPV